PEARGAFADRALTRIPIDAGARRPAKLCARLRERVARLGAAEWVEGTILREHAASVLAETDGIGAHGNAHELLGRSAVGIGLIGARADLERDALSVRRRQTGPRVETRILEAARGGARLRGARGEAGPGNARSGAAWALRVDPRRGIVLRIRAIRHAI